MDAAALEQWLTTATSKTIRLAVTENRSVFLSFKTLLNGELVVRAHRVFLNAQIGRAHV